MNLNHNCIACSQIALHPLLHRRRRSQWRAERNGVWGIEGNCAVPLDEKVRLQCSAVRDPLMWNPDPHLNMLTRWQQSLCEGAEQRAIHAEASGDTHPSVTRWIIEDTPPLPCFLHGLELAGCCIVKRPLEWRPRLWVDSSFFYLSIQLWELSLDTVLPPCRQLSKWFSCALSCFFRGLSELHLNLLARTFAILENLVKLLQYKFKKYQFLWCIEHKKKQALVVLFAVVAVCPHHAPIKVAAFFLRLLQTSACHIGFISPAGKSKHA